jgi:transposase
VLRRLIADRATVAAVARELGRSWDTINTIAIQATTELMATLGPVRLDGVRVIGVDEHRWAHTRHAAGEGYVTVIVDLTAVVENSGRARLLDLVAGRSAAALTTWLAARIPAFREQIEIVAMDGFGGYKNAATSAVPDAVTVMDPFHVVALAGPSWTCVASASSRTRRDTAAGPVIPSTGFAAPCAPAPSCSPPASGPAWTACSPTMPTPRSR